jgi:ribosomal-protein-alanine N-acetyltransferase
MRAEDARPQIAMTELQVRTMSARDLVRVLEIERQAYPFPWNEEIFRDCLRVGYVGLVGELTALVKAYAVMSVIVDEAHILNLCVEPGWQGRGHGRSLLLQLMERARQAQVKHLYLEVRPSNPAAMALYQSCGFNEIGVRRGYYPAQRGREDAVILAKTLSIS